MKVVFCWSTISGYMAACWRELARRPGIDLHVIAHRSGGSTAFHDSLLDGISHRYLEKEERHDIRGVERLVAAERPDVVVITGWWLKPYRSLAHSSSLAGCRFVMGVDTPWRHEAQFLTRFRYGGSLRRFDHFFVTGERSWQYVRRLGVPAERISRGMYGVDVATLASCEAERAAAAWPKQFVFAGRYEPEKGVDILAEAYALYREMVQNPWPLACCGRGSLSGHLAGRDGVIDLGFQQPSDLIDVLLRSGVFVLPSRFDPWPLALVEAAAAGLPIICTDACGSAVEVVRSFFNGRVVPTASVRALANTLRDVHARYDDLPGWGRRSTHLAAAYATEFWADRWIHVLKNLVSRSAGSPGTATPARPGRSVE